MSSLEAQKAAKAKATGGYIELAANSQRSLKSTLTFLTGFRTRRQFYKEKLGEIENALNEANISPGFKFTKQGHELTLGERLKTENGIRFKVTGGPKKVGTSISAIELLRLIQTEQS